MKKIVLFAMGLVLSSTTLAQEKIETTISGDFVSSYYWRGQDLGSVAVQPTFGVGYKGLSLTAWGSFGLTNPADTKEFDLTLGYTIGGLNIGVTDYWFSEGPEPEGNYFSYKSGTTNHVFEANIGYDFGVASLQWYTNFAGNDGTNKSGKRAYSSYVEASVPFKLGGAEWTATAGIVPYATDFYGADGFALTNLSVRASKAIQITNSFALPLFAQIAANPAAKKAYLVLGFTLQP